MGTVALFVPIFLSFSLFGMIAFVVWTNARARTDRARVQAAVQTKLIDRFGSAPELVEFLKSPEGRQFVGDIEQLPRHVAGEQILGGIRKGVTTALLGVGFLCVYMFWDNLGMLIPGFILLTLGLGFFISTIISVKLSRSWGLLPPKKITDDLSEP